MCLYILQQNYKKQARLVFNRAFELRFQLDPLEHNLIALGFSAYPVAFGYIAL